MSGLTRRPVRIIAALVAVAAAVVVTATVANAGGQSDTSKAKSATGRYHSLPKATAAGYGVLADKAGITCIDMPGQGAMGTHLADKDLVGDGLIDPSKPEALLYDRTGGKDRLLGMEYVVIKSQWKGNGAPSLFGQTFKEIPAGNRFGLPAYYALHAWLWTDNPSGTFNDWNPSVHC